MEVDVRSRRIDETKPCEAEVGVDPGTCFVLSDSGNEHDYTIGSYHLQGCLAHKKQPPPLGPPKDPRYSPTVGS